MKINTNKRSKGKQFIKYVFHFAEGKILFSYNIKYCLFSAVAGQQYAFQF